MNKIIIRKFGIAGLVFLIMTGFGGYLSYADGAIKEVSTNEVAWQIKHDSENVRGLVLDKQTNVYVTGYSFNGANFDCLTIKYDRNGNQVWEQRYDNGGNDAGYGITMDSQGNLYVAGFSSNGKNDDWLIIKYNPEGKLVWQKKQDYGSDDWAFGIAVDSHDNIYITGSSGNKSWITISYDPDGKERWQTTGGGEYGWGVAADGKDNVYVTGDSDQVMKYDANGKLIWKRTIPSFPIQGKLRRILSIIDIQSNIYVIGFYPSKITNDMDDYLVKYNEQGDVIWKNSYHGNGNDYFFAAAADSGGNVYVVGKPSDCDLIKYDANGKLLWKKKLSGIGTSYAVGCDAEGNVYWGYGVADKGSIIVKLVNQ